MRIDVLADDVLLGIFDFHVDVGPWNESKPIQAWQSLVHVCQRWRSLVLESPRRLNLHLLCTPKTPINDTLDVWLALPLYGQDVLIRHGQHRCSTWAEQSHTSSLLWGLAGWQLEKVLATMEMEELVYLRLLSHDVTGTLSVTPVPDSFLVDLPHVCNPSSCLEFHFRDFQNRYCLLITSSILTFPISLIPIHFTGSDGRSHLRVV